VIAFGCVKSVPGGTGGQRWLEAHLPAPTLEVVTTQAETAEVGEHLQPATICSGFSDTLLNQSVIAGCL
jgi:hypothetical protein